MLLICRWLLVDADRIEPMLVASITPRREQGSVALLGCDPVLVTRGIRPGSARLELSCKKIKSKSRVPQRIVYRTTIITLQLSTDNTPVAENIIGVYTIGATIHIKKE
jgi:hypothetical protein